MTDKEKKTISWYEYRHSKTGIPVEELQRRQSEIGKLGGHARKGKKLSEEHRLKIAEGRKHAKKETQEEVSKEEISKPTKTGS